MTSKLREQIGPLTKLLEDIRFAPAEGGWEVQDASNRSMSWLQAHGPALLALLESEPASPQESKDLRDGANELVHRLVQQHRNHPCAMEDCGLCEDLIVGYLGKAESATAESARAIPFNINEYVRVKVKPNGFQLLEKADKEMSKRTNGMQFNGAALLRKEQVTNGFVRYQLWSLMQDFGTHIGLGLDPPFETTIEFEVGTSAPATKKET